MAKSGKERAQDVRDKEKADGIKKITHKLTRTEAAWAEMYMDEQGYKDMTEWLIDHIPVHIKVKCQEIKNGMHTEG